MTSCLVVRLHTVGLSCGSTVFIGTLGRGPLVDDDVAKETRKGRAEEPVTESLVLSYKYNVWNSDNASLRERSTDIKGGKKPAVEVSGGCWLLNTERSML